jgi:hypothetical protein
VARALTEPHGLAQGGEVIVEDAGDAIVLRTVDQVIARLRRVGTCDDGRNAI